MNAIRISRVIAKTGLSRASIYRRISQDSTFPKPFDLGGIGGNCRARAFDEAEIDTWLEAKKAESRNRPQ